MTWQSLLLPFRRNSLQAKDLSPSHGRARRRKATRRAFFESLEDRRVLATISLGGGSGGWGLDPTFSSDGRVVTDLSSQSLDFAWDVAVQADGKIVAVGQVTPDSSTPSDFAIVRYNSDGTLDTTFGDGGIVAIDFGSGEDVAKGVVIQPDAKILVAGRADVGGMQFAVARLESDGSLDATFGGDGRVTTDFGAGVDLGEGIALQDDGKIVVAGTIADSQMIGIVRYNTDGSPDNTFDADGRREIDFDEGVSFETAADIALDPATDQIVVAAQIGLPEESTTRVGVARLTANGSNDTDFNSTGISVTSLGTLFGGSVEAVVVDNDGRVVTAGVFFNDEGNTDVFVQRYTAGGALDDEFNSDGLQTLDQGTNERAFAVVVQVDDRIVVAGSSEVAADSDDFLVARFNDDGSLDASFDSGAIVSDFEGEGDVAFGLAIQDDGTLVLAGRMQAESSDDAFALTRYAQTGGPLAFVVNENGTIELTGSYTTDSWETADITIDWGDGTTTVVDATAASGTFAVEHTYLDDVPTGSPIDINTITATIEDENDSDADTTTATVSNVAPVADPISGPAVAVRGQSVTFTGDFSDVGTLDTHVVAWDFGDGVQIPFQPSTAPGALAPSHAYANSGTYTVTFTVRDDDTGEDVVTTSIVVVIAQLQPAPCGCGTALVIGGTSAAETIVITPAAGGAVTVTINSVNIGTFNPSHAIVVHAYDGNDDVQIASSISRSAWLYGGDGNDRLKGGAGHDMLQGQDGDDLLIGGAGRDLLIGGTGGDSILGESNDDILIAGTTDHDDDDVALCHIMAEWTSCRLYYLRVANLTNGSASIFGQANGSYYLNSSTVHDDGVRDYLTGSSGFDWFFANICLDDDSPVKDKIVDRCFFELAYDIDFIAGP